MSAPFCCHRHPPLVPPPVVRVPAWPARASDLNPPEPSSERHCDRFASSCAYADDAYAARTTFFESCFGALAAFSAAGAGARHVVRAVANAAKAAFRRVEAGYTAFLSLFHRVTPI
eukprot:4836279-Pleurochrysis_carterae.AAC.1